MIITNLDATIKIDFGEGTVIEINKADIKDIVRVGQSVHISVDGRVIPCEFKNITSPACSNVIDLVDTLNSYREVAYSNDVRIGVGISLSAGVPTVITFTLNGIAYPLGVTGADYSITHESQGINVGYTNPTVNGFTVTADADCIFSYTATYTK